MFGGGYEIQKWVCSISFDQQDRICCYSETLQASSTLGVSLSQNTLFWSTLNPPKKTYFHLTSRTPSMFFWEVFPPSSMIFPIIFPPVFHHSIIFPIIFHYVSIILPLFFHRFPIIFHNVPSFFHYFSIIFQHLLVCFHHLSIPNPHFGPQDLAYELHLFGQSSSRTLASEAR